MVYVQVKNPSTAGTLNLTINGKSFPIAYGSGNGWEYATRGERGWTAYRTIPWSELGGAPSIGNTWNLSQMAYGKSWTGIMHWGLPDYSGVVVPGAQVVTTSLSADATTGGGTECGSDDWPSYFPTWGLRNEDGATATSQRTHMGLTSQVNVGQAQWDTADWPCYSRYYAMWDLPALPAGARVVSATVTMRHFGNPGYGGGYADDGTKDTVYQVYEIDQPWTELG
jgi:hypothetical protein